MVAIGEATIRQFDPVRQMRNTRWWFGCVVTQVPFTAVGGWGGRGVDAFSNAESSLGSKYLKLVNTIRGYPKLPFMTPNMCKYL